jgi:DNA-binding transcriptional ArsR family regulator
VKHDPDAVLKALASPLRRRIFQEVLRGRYVRPRTLAHRLKVDDSLLAHELGVLERAGVVGRLRLDPKVVVVYPRIKSITVGRRTILVPEEELDGSEMVEQAVRLLWRVRRR